MTRHREERKEATRACLSSPWAHGLPGASLGSGNAVMDFQVALGQTSKNVEC